MSDPVLQLLAVVDGDSASAWFWVVFLAVIVAAMALDLGVLHRKAHRIGAREASIMVSIWVSLAVLFGLLVWSWMDYERAFEFAAGYVVEYSLSVDNIFVFVMVFTYFAVPPAYQHRVLFWGIVGAAIMRMAFIFALYGLVEQFGWLLYVFALFLVATGIKLLVTKEVEIHPERNPLLRIVRRFVRVTKNYHEHHFIARIDGRLYVTPLFLVLVVVEATDVVFAVDSVPAIRGVTESRFIAYTSNIFAILGLRSMYFLVASVMDRFHYLKIGLSFVLIFIGLKMAAHSFLEIHPGVSLAVIVSILGTSVIASRIWPVPVELPAPVSLEGNRRSKKWWRRRRARPLPGPRTGAVRRRRPRRATRRHGASG